MQHTIWHRIRQRRTQGKALLAAKSYGLVLPVTWRRYQRGNIVITCNYCLLIDLPLAYPSFGVLVRHAAPVEHRSCRDWIVQGLGPHRQTPSKNGKLYQ